MKLFTEKLAAWKAEELEKCNSPEEKSTIVSFFCTAHFLLGLSHHATQALKEHQTTLEMVYSQLGRDSLINNYDNITVKERKVVLSTGGTGENPQSSMSGQSRLSKNCPVSANVTMPSGRKILPEDRVKANRRQLVQMENCEIFASLHGISQRQKRAYRRRAQPVDPNQGYGEDYNSYKEFVDKDTDALILTVSMDYFGIYTMEEKTRNEHEIRAHDLDMQPTPNPNSSPDKPKESCQEEDYKRNYTLARLFYGLFLRNMRDAVKEGDGERLHRLYSFALLYYRAYGHTQYAYSSFLSLHMAYSLVRTRIAFSTRGGGGGGQNISLDLNLENHNNFAKSFPKNMGPSLNENSALRVTRSLHYLKALMDNQNAALGRRGASGYHHKEKWDEDIKLLVEENRKADLLAVIPGRAFESFPSFNRNLLHKINYN
uniref:DUF6589 domain-containing protein n=1 Tax=Branchiostoma floridae TaxID=7739 RepID=C3ZUK7_BRAFL|eukprot:XP_002587708.1 hypothetical protein BRAFLDRAFT_94611 [Branchiostoma floridae]